MSGITGTPNVNIVNTSPIPVSGNTSITGTPTVTVVNNQNSVRFTGTCNINNYQNCITSPLMFVPDKKRLVIEYFSCSADLDVGQRLTCAVGALSDLDSIMQYLPTSPPASDFPGTTAAGQQIRMYAGSGWKVVAYVFSEYATGVRAVQFHFSGYLEDAP